MTNEKDQKKSKEELEDVEILEFSLSEEEIDSLIEKLRTLKKTKTDFSFKVDENNEFIIHYVGYEEKSKKNSDDEGDERFYEEKEDE